MDEMRQGERKRESESGKKESVDGRERDLSAVCLQLRHLFSYAQAADAAERCRNAAADL